ncbi:MAG: hypothetical protein ACE147_07890 [Candidatus Methylomirabilales bacterium]
MTSLPPPAIRIRPLALAKLRCYARRCPFEIGGLGDVVADPEGLLITDVFILPQRVSMSDTELSSEGLFAFLSRLVAEGRDVSRTRVWWHSHGEMEVSWSDTDAETIENLPGEYWVAVVTNRRGEVRCRLDAYAPVRQTWNLPLEEVGGEGPADPARLEAQVDQEILAQVSSPLPLEDLLGTGLGEDLAESPSGGEARGGGSCER